MREARRGEALDFNTVLTEEAAPEYKRTTSNIGNDERKRKQREFRKLLDEGSKNLRTSMFIEPRYDEHFWRAVETLDRDPD
jgi:hypothetical protein